MGRVDVTGNGLLVGILADRPNMLEINQSNPSILPIEDNVVSARSDEEWYGLQRLFGEVAKRMLVRTRRCRHHAKLRGAARLRNGDRRRGLLVRGHQQPFGRVAFAMLGNEHCHDILALKLWRRERQGLVQHGGAQGSHGARPGVAEVVETAELRLHQTLHPRIEVGKFGRREGGDQLFDRFSQRLATDR